MLRLVWRQHRVALCALLALSAVAIGVLIRSEMFDRGFPAGMWRAYVWQSYGPNYPDLAMQAIPLLAALFVGVRLVAGELEDGTAHFAWTQGYGKARWALGKLAAAAAVLVPMAVVLGLVFGWWHRLFVPVPGYFTMHAFALYAPALVGWTVAGLTLGMTAAALTRREGRAMWLTLAGWVVLHHFAIVGSPGTPAGEFWPLQFAQLAILLAISGLLAYGTIVLIQGAPALPGMPRLLRAVPAWATTNAQALARKLASRRLMAVPRATWRQHRAGLLTGLTLLGIYVAALVISGLHIHAEPARLRPAYANLAGQYMPNASSAASFMPSLLLPFLIGAFLGGSVTASDLDHGTVRFAWAQGVTRSRWIAGKLVAVGCVLVAAAIAAGLVFQWWDQPYIAERLSDPWFALYAPVYAGWMAVTLTAAAFLGALSRRIRPGVVCLFVTLVAAAANAIWLRNHYLPNGLAVNRPAPSGSRLINWHLYHANGLPNAISNRLLQNFDQAAGWTSIERALARHHSTSVFIYQPASQFWQLQAIECAGLFAMALLFGAAAVWLVRHKEA
jgi:ABC-type transport system involved in multi-copper enzyme maturation permease subunit